MFQASRGFHYTKSSAKSTYSSFKRARYSPNTQTKINQFVDMTMCIQARNQNPYQTFLRLVTQHYDLSTIIIATIYLRKLQAIITSLSSQQIVGQQFEKMAVSSFILADFFVNDNPNAFNIMQSEGLDVQKISSETSNFIRTGSQIFVSKNDYEEVQKEFEDIDYM